MIYAFLRLIQLAEKNVNIIISKLFLHKNNSIYLGWQLQANFVQNFKGSTRRFCSEGVYSLSRESSLQNGLLPCIEHAPANIIIKAEPLLLKSGKHIGN